MCTALVFCPGGHYFGRTLDYEVSFGECICITPRNVCLPFRQVPPLAHHHAIIGMARVEENFPLYFEAINEAGLAMAGLNFSVSAYWFPPAAGRDNLAPFELIPWVLGQCASLGEAEALLSRLRLINLSFSEELPLSPLHWLLSDATRSLTIESTAEGLHIYDNPVGVLTNEPPFPQMLFHFSNFRDLSPLPSENRFSSRQKIPLWSRGMGAMGLPGDYSSQSRFVRAAFVKENSLCGTTEAEEVSQFFHILRAVEQPRGSVRLERGCEISRYASCCNLDRGIYYYTTYENSALSAVDLYREDLTGEALLSYPLLTQQTVTMQN